MQIYRVLCLVLLAASFAAHAGGAKVRKLVEMNFEYVRLVYDVAKQCAKSADAYAKTPDDKQLAIETMRCYSFLLEKREKLEREVFVPLRSQGFPGSNPTDREKQFVMMVYVIDDSIEDAGKAIEPVLKQKMGKGKMSSKKAVKGIRKRKSWP